MKQAPITILFTICIATSLLIGGCKQNERNSFQTINLILDSGKVTKVVPHQFHSLSVENRKANENVQFYLISEDCVPMGSALQIVKHILRNARFANDSAVALWKFVAEHGDYNEFDVFHNSVDNVRPSALLTFPYFMCGEKAGILANMATLASLKAHTLPLKGHVVTEIYYSNNWHLFDADHGCFFTNSNGEIVNAKQLRENYLLLENVQIANGFNDSRTQKYKGYLMNYYNGLSDTSLIIHLNQTEPLSIELRPNDKITFLKNRRSSLQRFWNSTYEYETKGMLETKFKIEMTDGLEDTASFCLTLPFYFTALEIDSKVKANIAIVYDSNKGSNSYDMGCTGKNILKRKFNFPESDLIREVKIKLSDIKSDSSAEFELKVGFILNSKLFPANIHFIEN